MKKYPLPYFLPEGYSIKKRGGGEEMAFLSMSEGGKIVKINCPRGVKWVKKTV